MVPIYCINLASSTGRRRRMERRFARHGLTSDVRFNEATGPDEADVRLDVVGVERPDLAAVGCLRSHLAALRRFLDETRPGVTSTSSVPASTTPSASTVTTLDANAGAGVPGSSVPGSSAPVGGSQLPATGGGLGRLPTAAALLAAGVAVTAVARAPRSAHDLGVGPSDDLD